ncbi:MAG: flavin reductase family protein [Promethearchaeia archaeon]
MGKKKIQNSAYLYPLPMVLVGATVEEKPNFMPIAWVSVAEYKPPMISISAAQNHYTNKGIRTHQTFSINIPSVKIVEKMDYCGMQSGEKIDKSGIFEVFYGDLENAPMIESAPLNMECKVKKTIETGHGHEIFLGEVINSYANEEIIRDGIPNVKKLQPLMYITKDKEYWTLGEKFGKAWNIGRNYKE